MLKLNETPIRTANNFRINNIEIDAQIPEIIPEFENVQIIKENSEVDENVSNKELVYGNNKELENIVFSKANSKIRIVNNKKTENVKIIYTFDEESFVLLNQIEIIASEDINVVIEYKAETEQNCFHAGIIRTFASNGAKINVTVVNLLNDESTNIESYENNIEEDSKVYHKLIDIGAKESVSNYYSNVTGNKATVVLSGDADGAAGYDYVISTDRDCITNKDYDSVNKNQVQTSTTFKYVQQGTYYAYCHAWKRDENGKKVFSDWSNAYPFVVSAITPDAPVITNVTVSGSTIKVTYKAAANATGYDVVLGTGSKKENGETRPYHYGNHKKLNLKEGTVTATFKNVPKGTWVVGMHAFNRTSEDGKKVFSPWSNLKKATVK